MQNVHSTMQRAIAPHAPPPITPEALQALRARARAWAEVAQIEASDANYHRALLGQQRQQHPEWVGASR